MIMETRYFDPETLFSLLGDDKGTVIKMLENIIINALKRYDTLNTDFTKEDWSSLKSDAHYLKSNFRYLGCSELTALLKNIEFWSMDHDKRAEIKVLVKEFNENFPLVIKEVEDYVNYLKN